MLEQIEEIIFRNYLDEKSEDLALEIVSLNDKIAFEVLSHGVM